MNRVQVYVGRNELDINRILEEIANRPIPITPPTNREFRVGLMDEEILMLNSYKLYDKLDDSCPICREEYQRNQSVIELTCKHIFHRRCLLPWVSSHSTCPVCRFNIKKDTKDILKILMYMGIFQNVVFNALPLLYQLNQEQDGVENNNQSWWKWIKCGVSKCVKSFF